MFCRINFISKFWLSGKTFKQPNPTVLFTNKGFIICELCLLYSLFSLKLFCEYCYEVELAWKNHYKMSNNFRDLIQPIITKFSRGRSLIEKILLNKFKVSFKSVSFMRLMRVN